MNTKTMKVAVYPDGTRKTISKQGTWWVVPENHGASKRLVQYLSDVRSYVTEDGGSIETVPNPHYHPVKRLRIFEHLTRSIR